MLLPLSVLRINEMCSILYMYTNILVLYTHCRHCTKHVEHEAMEHSQYELKISPPDNCLHGIAERQPTGDYEWFLRRALAEHLKGSV